MEVCTREQGPTDLEQIRNDLLHHRPWDFFSSKRSTFITLSQTATRRFVWDATNTSNVTTAAPNVGGFLQGVRARFANEPALALRIQQESNSYGVGSDTTAQP